MKPLKTELQDAETLRDLGSASVQIVHDLKNQLNGLKLYATFLRKRMEKSDRPADELETITKLISGLERAAADMTVLVRFGRTLELRRQPGTDLARLLADSSDGASFEADDGGSYEGDFDPVLLAEALKTVAAGVRGEGAAAADGSAAAVRLRRDGTKPVAVVEWSGAVEPDAEGDPFRSLAGAAGLRLALAAKIIRAHGGEVSREGGVLRARLPLQQR
ncbi:MAG: two-component system, NtrC family, sensor histidine kinase HydH [Acidobacteriota bacterium]|nr:two-component system, NtrC family, sensor histidine kinase HydH [Acidobacteriota bacterium]